MPDLKPLIIWAVSDGRAGIKNQVLGLAEALARQLSGEGFTAQITPREIIYQSIFNRLPNALKLWPDAMLAADSDVLEPPWPAIWIGAGRATLPHAMRLKKRSDGKTFVVQLQDPRQDLKAFDLVIAPKHDAVKGENTMSILGSTHRVTQDRLETDFQPWRFKLEGLARPHIAVLIGGKSKAHDLSVKTAQALAAEIKTLVERVNGSLLLTLSRRTPAAARAIFKATVKDLPGLIYDDEGENPYFAFLHTADHILVTEDSVNMATEAAATGKPVHILAIDKRGQGRKFADFHDALMAHGAARPFAGELRSWSYEPLDETRRAAETVFRKYIAR
jgi:uncharacterized protein